MRVCNIFIFNRSSVLACVLCGVGSFKWDEWVDYKSDRLAPHRTLTKGDTSPKGNKYITTLDERGTDREERFREVCDLWRNFLSRKKTLLLRSDFTWMEWEMIVHRVLPMAESVLECRVDNPDLVPLVFRFLGSVLDFCIHHLVNEPTLDLFVMSTLANLFACRRFYAKVPHALGDLHDLLLITFEHLLVISSSSVFLRIYILMSSGGLT